MINFMHMPYYGFAFSIIYIINDPINDKNELFLIFAKAINLDFRWEHI